MGRALQPPSRWRDLRGVLRPTGAVIAGLAVAEAGCALIGGGYEWWTAPAGRVDWMDAVWLVAIAVGTFLIGYGAQAYGRRFSGAQLNRREALLTVVSIWITAGAFGGLPFMLIAGLDPAEAFFETMSGMTSTGATVIGDVEARLSPPLLLWRSAIQWLGGMGIVVLFVAVFPSVGAGAKHMYKGEVAGTTVQGLKPRIAETSFTLWKLYAGLTVLEAALLVVCGVDPFEALCHAFTTMSTGGFSTRDGSIAAFESPAVEYVVSVFMILAGLNFALFYAAFRQRTWKPMVRSVELLVFVMIVAGATLATTLGILHLHDHDLERAFRTALFQVASFVSSTGYRTDDYMAYPGPILATLVCLMFVGGCAGSTAGGLKVERLVLLAKQSWSEVRRSFRPAMVDVVRMGQAAIPRAVLSEVAAFFAVYVGVIVAGALAVTALEGVSLETAFGATLTCLANSGPAFWHSPAGEGFHVYSGLAQIIFAIVMLLGRLELFTVLALFVPDFWRR